MSDTTQPAPDYIREQLTVKLFGILRRDYGLVRLDPALDNWYEMTWTTFYKRTLRAEGIEPSACAKTDLLETFKTFKRLAGVPVGGA